MPHIKPIIEMCLVIAGNKDLEDALRVKAISFLGTLTRIKKKTIVKHKLYIQMINQPRNPEAEELHMHIPKNTVEPLGHHRVRRP